MDVQPLRGAAAAKAGPHLWNKTLPEVSARGALVLANNHLMDFGDAGLQSTLAHAKAAGWRCVGAGTDGNAARQPIVIEHDGARITVLARCEAQFGAAQQAKSGTAILGPDLFRQVHTAKAASDVVVISVHAAFENSPWPSPSHQNFMRALIEAGADVVHGHHAHVPQGFERYEHGAIFYSLGNFCVDTAKWHASNTRWSLVVDLAWSSGRLEFAPITHEIDEVDGVLNIRPSTTDEAADRGAYLERVNAPLHDKRLLEGLWQEAAIRSYESFYGPWLGFILPPCANKRPVRQRLRRLVGESYRLLRSHAVQSGAEARARQDRILLHHVLFACDSHRDAIATALGVLGGELPDLRDARTAALADAMLLRR